MRQLFSLVITCLLLTLPTFTQAAALPAEIDSKMVRVLVYKNNEVYKSYSGVVVSEGVVLTTANSVVDDSRIVVLNKDKAELGASVMLSDSVQNIALLKVNGLKQAGITLSKEKTQAGRLVTAVGFDVDANGIDSLESSNGSISSVDHVAKTKVGQTMITHNAMIKLTAFGGMLLNNCGELIAINMPEPQDSSFFSSAVKAPVDKVFALDIKSIESMLDVKLIPYKVAKTVCLTDAEQAKKAAAAAIAAKKKADDEAKAAKEKAEKTVKETQKKADAKLVAATKKAAELAKKKEAALKKRIEEEKNLSEKEKQALQKELKELERVKLEAVNKQKEVERKQAEEREQQDMILIGIAAGVVLLILIVLYLLKRKKQALLQAKADAQAAHLQKESAQAAVNAEIARKQKLQQLPNILLDGVTPSGDRVTLKISGMSIGESPQGVVVGRNPAKSEYILNYEEVSREQFRLLYVRDQLMIEDLESTNGTLLNGEPLTPYQPEAIMNGAVIEINDLEITLTNE